MMRIAFPLFFVLASFLGASPSVQAVEVLFKNGEVIEGNEMGRDEDNLYLEREGTITNFALSRIASIDGEIINVAPKVAPDDKKAFTLSFMGNGSEMEKIDIPWSRVRKAYRDIPHRQVTFEPKKAKMSPKSALILNELFTLVDYAVVARVETMRWFQSGGTRGRSYKSYQDLADKIMVQLKNLTVPRELKRIKQLIFDSMRAQKNYFEAWNDAKSRGQKFDLAVGESGWEQHPNIQSSHQKLIQAHNELIKIYESEDQETKEAFFDHLCALDFV